MFENELEQLKNLKNDDDTEVAHYRADEILKDILTKLGYDEIVMAYKEISKWYA